MNPNWQELFIKEAGQQLFIISLSRQPDYNSAFDLAMLNIMEDNAKKLIPIIQNLFN